MKRLQAHSPGTIFFPHRFAVAAGVATHGFVLVLCLCLPLTVSAQMFRPDKTDNSKRCAICHFEWVYAFYTERRDGELIPQPRDKRVATAAMCFSCHDGSIVDSRKTVLHDPGHRNGIVPSANVVIPSEFPLDEGGRMQCATCHTPHAIASGDGSSVEFFLRAPNKNSSFCQLCHRGTDGGKEAGNHPTGIALKSIPPALVDGGGLFGTGQPPQIICETCHAPHGGEKSVALLLAIEDPATRSTLCEACHTRNPGRSPEPGLNQFSHPTGRAPGKTATPPATWPGGEKVIVGRKGELVCRTCHKPHGASPQALLIEKGIKDELCRQCHPVQFAVAGSQHDLRTSSPQALNIQNKPARELGPCSSCHLVHSGSAAFMWAQSMPDEKRNPSHFCTCCHRDGKCASSAIPGDFSHPMDVGCTDMATCLPLPLFDSQGRVNPAGTVSCSTCHDVHAPRSPSAGATVVKNENAFLRSVPGKENADLCLHCHQQQAMVKGSKHDLSITNPSFTNLLHQTPARGGLCSPCHIAHGAASKRYIWAGISGLSLLPLRESEKVSGDIIMTICTGCHSSNDAASGGPSFEPHPAGLVLPYELQRFPEYAHLLHYPDGGSIPRGGVTCATCHNPHLWDTRGEDTTPAKDIQGDASNSFLRESIHKRLCASCHGEEGLLKFLFYHRPEKTRRLQPFTQLQRKK